MQTVVISRHSFIIATDSVIADSAGQTTDAYAPPAFNYDALGNAFDTATHRVATQEVADPATTSQQLNAWMETYRATETLKALWTTSAAANALCLANPQPTADIYSWNSTAGGILSAQAWAETVKNAWRANSTRTFT